MFKTIFNNIIHNPKTTLTGVACGVVILLSAVGVLPAEWAALAISIAGGGASTALVAHANDPKK